MNCHNDLPNHRMEESNSIPRSPSTTDLLVLLYQPPSPTQKSENRGSLSFASIDQLECDDLENSQVLYMAGPPKRLRKSRASLSSIGNRSTQGMDGSSDTKADAEEDSFSDELTWNIIDREIFEWQYACRTGRPHWWSPESRYSRLRKLPPRLTREPPPRPEMRGVDERPKTDYGNKRRAISDSYLAGQVGVENLAHLVAIQLLGSCFTLPPDHNGMLLPDYTSYDLNGSENSPDPRLISSLRLHTHFRYSPCFGHQARNTSPVQLWSGAYDGPSPNTSPLPMTTGFQTPVIGTSGSRPRRCGSRRPLNVTEGSESNCSLENQAEDYVNSFEKCNLDPTASVTAWYRRQGIDDDNARRMILTYIPGESGARRQQPKAVQIDGDMDIPQGYRGVQSSPRTPKTNYSLQPVIRSEPHHVFVQPVRELVVKRWRTFRRRFGGSLHAPLPTGSEGNISTPSTPGYSGGCSPAMSSDGRARRRRAQERGEILSASVDSTPHYNSPISGYLSPRSSGYPSPFWIDSMNSSPAFQLADPLAAAAALVLAKTQSSAPSVLARNQRELPLSSTGSSHQTSEVASRREPKTGANPSMSYTRTLQRRSHRMSMLSEVCTPEDLIENVTGNESPKEAAERSGLSAAGSARLGTKEKLAEVSDINLVIRSGACESVGNIGPVGAFSVRRRMTVGETPLCPRLSRTSTTGTQVFKPNADGIEIDGLPVGPSKKTWSGKRRERTYL